MYQLIQQGPLHVGHGRGAAFGATLRNVLSASGYDVTSEYYVNDAGRQMNILAASVWVRYLELAGEPVVIPANAYKGDYVSEIANELWIKHGRTFVHFLEYPSLMDLPMDEPQGGDKELYIDAFITQAKTLLNEEVFSLFHQHALNTVLDDIKDDLAEFGVRYDTWFDLNNLYLKMAPSKKGIESH